MINIRVRALLDLTISADLGSLAGTSLSIPDHPVSRVESGSDAMSMLAGYSWEIAFERFQSRLRYPLADIDQKEFDKWNDYAIEVSGFIGPYVESKKPELLSRFGIDDSLALTIRRILQAGLIEEQYAEIVPLGAMSRALKWFIAGHIVCSCDGVEADSFLYVY